MRKLTLIIIATIITSCAPVKPAVDFEAPTAEKRTPALGPSTKCQVALSEALRYLSEEYIDDMILGRTEDVDKVIEVPVGDVLDNVFVGSDGDPRLDYLNSSLFVDQNPDGMNFWNINAEYVLSVVLSVGDEKHLITAIGHGYDRHKYAAAVRDGVERTARDLYLKVKFYLEQKD